MKYKTIAISFAAAVFAAAVAVAVFELSGPARARQENFVVLRGENALQIAANLKAEGYIKSKTVFVLDVFLRGMTKKLKAGKYALDGLDEARIVTKIASSQTVPVEFTIVPGWTLQDVAKNLSARRIAASDEFLAYALGKTNACTYDLSALKKRYPLLSDLPDGAGLEGYLYPDTYQIGANAGAQDITERMLENLEKKVTPEVRQTINDQGRSFFEIVTMASMLEKEVKTVEDKKIVAGILWKRRDSGMTLDVDSTLLYFLAGDHPSLDDKDVDSPYNTYKYGFPVGPICNPGIDSIKAAANPTATDYWFYLSAKDGTTIYSKTYGEHLINKAKHLE